MKKLIIAVASLMVAVGAYGQGQFFFSNHDTTANVTARFILPGDTGTGTGSSVGSDGYTITLMGGPTGTPVANLVALNPSTDTFRGAANSTLAGYVSPVTVTVPNVAAGASADVLVQVTGAGGSFSHVFTIPGLGGGTITPPTIPMGANALSLTPVPEPTVLALGAMGLGALLVIRRRK